MPKFVLSPQAQKSLQNIHSFSIEHFGTQQTRNYLTALRDRMRHLASNPLEGQKRDEIKTGYYSYFEGSHTIYYRTSNSGIEVIDVLHQRMEPDNHL
ncbi:type II toxin-antitoxin system RelE/ParE family toxin [Alteromonadaceae bacterium BrNp21-10]|nr:type II toxin-antitoxin system RelE/ParE family toxin [Alteromonadaceae bacterium BrNp21-10]